VQQQKLIEQRMVRFQRENRFAAFIIDPSSATVNKPLQPERSAYLIELETHPQRRQRLRRLPRA
jgi:hypothetical protein